MSKSRYFHEDDYCQIEILPAENLQFCLKQAGKIDEFADEHRDGIGFTDIYVRKENPVMLAEMKIPAQELHEVLIPVMEKCDEVFTGYSSYREKCENTVVFDMNESISLFYNVKDGMAENIWLELTPSTQEEVDTAMKMFEALLSLGDFIIADWSRHFVRKISDRDNIQKYMNERLEFFSK